MTINRKGALAFAYLRASLIFFAVGMAANFVVYWSLGYSVPVWLVAIFALLWPGMALLIT